VNHCGIEASHRRGYTAVCARDDKPNASSAIHDQTGKVFETMRRATRAERHRTEKAKARAAVRIVRLRLGVPADVK
jgi:hypothetical protein